MRLTITALGLELDLTFGPVAVAEPEPTSNGDALSTGIAVGTVTTWLGETGMEGEIPEDRRVGFRRPT